MPDDDHSPPPAWAPLPGPQSDAYRSKADILFYGGAAGGGKTDLLLGAAFFRHRRSIIFRREYAQLRAIIDRGSEIAGEFGRFNKSNLLWSLEDGGQVELGAVQHVGDERKYQGRAHDLKAFDEITHFTESQFRMLCGWLRSADPSVRCRVIATGNPPTDSDGEWVIRYFAPWLDKAHAHPAKPGELRWYTTLGGKDTELESDAPFERDGEWIVPKSRTFIPARVEDNPYYMATGYRATLQALPEPLRSQMLYGDFSAGREDNPYQLIPSAWLELAIGRHKGRSKPTTPLSAIGVDVARGGRDATVVTLRYGNWFELQKTYPGSFTPDGDTVARLVLAARGTETCPVNIDVIGVGASVYDCLRRAIGGRAHALHASKATAARDSTGQLEFVNSRAEWWWSLREALDPAGGADLALPDDRELFADLAAPHYHFTPRGVLIESKDEIVKRIGRSPDKGDSLVYAFVVQHVPYAGLLEFCRKEAGL